jgi:hypothetical protein
MARFLNYDDIHILLPSSHFCSPKISQQNWGVSTSMVKMATADILLSE